MSMVSVAAAALYLVPGIFFQRRLGYMSGIRYTINTTATTAVLVSYFLPKYWYLISYQAAVLTVTGTWYFRVFIFYFLPPCPHSPHWRTRGM